MTFQSQMPPVASAWSKVIEQAGAEFSPLPVPIATVWNPDTCPEHMLPWLAVNLSVDLWRAEWPVWKKRQVCREAIINAGLKGTLAGLKRYLAQVDADLVSITTPPVKAFAGASYSKVELDQFYSAMPQLRIYRYRARNRNVFGKMFAGRGIGPGRFALASVARAGRRTFLFDPLDQSLKPLVTVAIETASETRSAIEISRIVEPGRPGNSLFAGGHANRAVGVIAKRSVVRSIEIDHTYLHSQSAMRLSTVEPGLDPLSVRHEEATDRWRGRGGKFFAGRGARRFAAPSDAWLHIYTLVRLHDPARAPALRHGSRLFAGSRLGIAPHTATTRVRLRLQHRKRTFFAGRSAGRVYARPIETRLRDGALEAVHAAKAAHEKILVSFQNFREPVFGDAVTLDGTRTFGTLIPRRP